jgi:hypothetical protein
MIVILNSTFAAPGSNDLLIDESYVMNLNLDSGVNTHHKET